MYIIEKKSLNREAFLNRFIYSLTNKMDGSLLYLHKGCCDGINLLNLMRMYCD